MMNPNDGFNRFRNMIGRQGAAPSNNDYGLGSGSPGVNPAPEPNAAWPNKWKGGDMFGAPPPPQQKPMDIAPVNPPGGPVSTYNPGPAESGGFGLGPYNPNGKPGGSWGGVPPSNVYGGKPDYSPVNPPGGPVSTYNPGPMENGGFGGPKPQLPTGGFGNSGPYNPFGKPGSISGAVPMGNIEGGPFGPPRPDPTPVDTFGGPKTPWKGDPFQDRPNPMDPLTPEGGPGSPVRPDPTPTDTFGPPPVSQDFGNLGGMGFEGFQRPEIQRQPGGWKWGAMMNPMNQNSGW